MESGINLLNIIAVVLGMVIAAFFAYRLGKRDSQPQMYFDQNNMKSLGSTSPMPNAATASNWIAYFQQLPEEIQQQIKQELAREQMIHAIKIAHKATKMGLKETKDMVEAVRDAGLHR